MHLHRSSQDPPTSPAEQTVYAHSYTAIGTPKEALHICAYTHTYPAYVTLSIHLPTEVHIHTHTYSHKGIWTHILLCTHSLLYKHMHNPESRVGEQSSGAWRDHQQLWMGRRGQAHATWTLPTRPPSIMETQSMRVRILSNPLSQGANQGARRSLESSLFP